MKKSKSVILLIVWFMWATGKDLDAIVRYGITSDYYVFASNDLTSIFFIFAFSVFSLNTATVYYLFKPEKAGIYAAFIALGIALLQNVVTTLMALGNLQGVRDAYAAGREVRGLSVREDTLNLIFTPEGIYTSLAVMIAFYAVIGFILFKNRGYFNAETRDLAA
ncbi:hypothetical protein KUL152_11270 [Tenacibaculum sp. KUL152]|nr:hypothetical protein KUL152_11270 [Tenacibaculum sp. KUL152]